MAWSRTVFASSVRFIACNKSAFVLRFSNRSSFWIDKSAHLSPSSRLVLWVRQKLAASFNVSHEYWARPRSWFRIDDMTVSLRLTETRNGTAIFSHFIVIATESGLRYSNSYSSAYCIVIECSFEWARVAYWSWSEV